MTPLQVALLSLGIGLLLGYIGQRSRLCFMGAFRDLFLVRDWRGVQGVAAFLVTAAITFAVAGWLGRPAMADYPSFTSQLKPAGQAEARWIKEDVCGVVRWSPLTDDPLTVEDVLGGNEPVVAASKPVYPFRVLGWTVLGAMGLGFFSNVAGGCPFRQHVLAGQGDVSAWWYMGGFYVAAVVFTLWLAPVLPLT